MRRQGRNRAARSPHCDLKPAPASVILACGLQSGRQMGRIRQIALQCVGRAVMFGSLAIGCVMVGFSFNPVSAFRSGAFMALMMAAVLMWKAMTAGTKNPKRTEVWLYLDEKARPIDAAAQKVFRTVMREVYVLYAWISFGAAVGLFALSLVFMLFGLKAYVPPSA